MSVISASECVKNSAADLSGVDLFFISSALEAADYSVEKGKKSIECVLDELAMVCSNKVFIHSDWGLLAGRLVMRNIQYEAPPSFSQSVTKGKNSMQDKYVNFVVENAAELNAMIDPTRDFSFDYFAARTMQKSYLGRVRKDSISTINETPQYLYMRIAVYLWYPDMSRIRRTYDDLSLGNYTHASPTMFNSGLLRPQLSSCFLIHTADSLQSISKCWHDAALISQSSGGIGIDMASLRHSEIGHHGYSNGIVPWLRVMNAILSAVDQEGRRKGSGTIFLRDWHIDVYEFVDAKNPEGAESIRARDLFYGLMVSDLFMRRVKNDEEWTLFCPAKAKLLTEKWGIDFEMSYLAYERDRRIFPRRVVRARDLWSHIINLQIKTGMPFIVYIDTINRKSNQRHSGIIRSSNLCVEIAEVTSEKEIASCTLASIAVNKCVKMDDAGVPHFDFDMLARLTSDLVRNLNQVIDKNYYSDKVPEIRYSNFRHRPLGIGVQGLADAFALMDISWARRDDSGTLVLSPKAQRLNRDIFETMYYAGIRESIEMAKEFGHYDSFPDSPASKGHFQFDLWALEEVERNSGGHVTMDYTRSHARSTPEGSRYTPQQWEHLRREMVCHGLRNSLLFALMPTASSAHILGNAESFEPFHDLIYARTVLSGQYLITNKHMIRDLVAIDVWNTDVLKSIILDGSLKNVSAPSDASAEVRSRLEFLKLKYLTVFELPQKILAHLASERGRFVCQSQSFNCHMTDPNFTKLNAYHFYTWQMGMKTGMYYLRQKAATNPINFALDSISIPVRDTSEVCESCQG
jgi:ribonucleoside-diphosphate reductase alpha chain